MSHRPRVHLATPAAVAFAFVLCASGTSAEEKAATSSNAGSYSLDPAHTTIGFQIRHLVSKVPGRFGTFSGVLDFDPANLAATRVQVDIDAASISTGVEKRDTHLKSADFFEVEKFPKITFKSTSVKVADGTHAQMTGDLTIKGITKSVILDVEVLGVGPGLMRETRAGFEAHGKIDRTDFNVVWNRTLEGGGTLLGDDVDIVLSVEAFKPPAEAEAARKG
jgi:polyisoprenoid-binding protein YceI